MSAPQKGRPAAELVNDTEEPVKVLASEIRKLSAATAALNAGPLKRDTIVLLIAHASGVAQRDVRRVLDAMGDLGRRYTK